MFTPDLRLALRQLHKNPGFGLTVILTLALGVGVNTAVFTLLNGFLLRPLPYPEPDHLAVLVLHREGISAKSGQFYSEDDPSQDGETWEMVRDGVPSVRAASFGGTSGVNLQAGPEFGSSVHYVQDMRVSAHYFEVLGIQPFLGRGFTEQEDRSSGPNAVILSYALWQSAFQADAHLLGKGITVKGESYTVVGVLPKRAQPIGVADIFTPLQPHQSGECGGDNCEIILRLIPGASWQQVSAELAHLRKAWFDEVTSKDKGRASPLARNLDNGMRGPIVGLMLAVSLILLIACANLAGLMLVRIARRAPEIATRLALGATRWDVLRQLWWETFVLALIGAAIGLGFGSRNPFGITGIFAGRPDAPRWTRNRFSGSGIYFWNFSADQPAIWRAACFADSPVRSSIVYGQQQSLGRPRLEPSSSIIDRRRSRSDRCAGRGGRTAGPQPRLPGDFAAGLRCY